MSVVCPIAWVQEDRDFLSQNGAWLLSVIGLGTTCIGVVLTYFLKSRCKHLECCGIVMDRDVVVLDQKTMSVGAA